MIPKPFKTVLTDYQTHELHSGTCTWFIYIFTWDLAFPIQHLYSTIHFVLYKLYPAYSLIYISNKLHSKSYVLNKSAMACTHVRLYM